MIFNLQLESNVYKIGRQSNEKPIKNIIDNKPNNFDGIATKKRYKLYVIIGAKIFYVGIAKVPISARFHYGVSCRKSMGKGYHGYKWLDELNNGKKLDLFIFGFKGLQCNTDFTKNNTYQKGKQDPQKIVAETIEAELVYIIRKNTNEWCKYQNEIHFHNLGEQPKNTAKEIYKNLRKHISYLR